MDLGLNYILVLSGVIIGLSQAVDILQICETEMFEAECGQNEVILVTHARYGRMRQGRCIPGSFGKTGCIADARPYLDAQCSGRKRCDVAVATLVPPEVQKCPQGLRSYLEVVYECVKVVNASLHYCQNTEAVEVKDQHGYLSSLVTMETGCGSLDSPWWVTVKPGQTITVTLLDFGLKTERSSNSPDSQAPVCHVYSIIKEQTSPQSTKTMCAGSMREETVFTSSINRLEVRLVAGKDFYFLLRFEANGCPDPDPLVNGWVERSGNDVTFGCDGENQKWRLKCEGNEWVGPRHNCSDGLSILIILIIAVTVGLCILAVGLIHIMRKRRHRDTSDPLNRREPDVQYGPPAPLDKPAVPLNRNYTNKTGDSTEFYHTTENDYYRTWQLQRHAPPPHHMAPLPSPAHYAAHASMPHPPGTGSSASAYQKSTQSANEHIYESPKFARKDYGSDDYDLDGINAEYFELDPDSNKTT